MSNKELLTIKNALISNIEEQLSIVTDNMVEEQYKSRNILNYTQALNIIDRLEGED